MNACGNQIQELLFTSTVQCLHQVIDSVYAIDIAIALEQFDKGSLFQFMSNDDIADVLGELNIALKETLSIAESLQKIKKMVQKRKLLKQFLL